MASSGSKTALIGCHLPRRCGIATFTSDLADALESASNGADVSVVAMNDVPGGYDYPPRVEISIDQEELDQYLEAADYLNDSDVDVVCLQHEYGIFGGDYGAHILELVRLLEKPLVVTLHTVYRDPNRDQRMILEELAARAERVVVMSRLGADFLGRFYGVAPAKIVLIPHGIHDVPLERPGKRRRIIEAPGRILLTFGLLHRSKGIEYMIDALPAILEKHPDVTYVVLGTTHPRIFRLEGESYRRLLVERAEARGVRENIRFIPRFAGLDELLDFLRDTDIFVTPYLTREYITSGALAYAMGAGKAVVSTPYWYALEMLAGGRGRIVPMRDPQALAEAVCELLDDEGKLREVQESAYLHCRRMVWSEVGREYHRLLREVSLEVPTVFRIPASRFGEGRGLGLGDE